MCVSSVHCLSQEWETSEYSHSLLCKPQTRLNAACHKTDSGNVDYGIVPLPSSSLVNPVPPWVLSSSSSEHGGKSCHQWDIEGLVLHPYMHVCLTPLLSTFILTLPFQFLNLNLFLLFIAFACLEKNQTPPPQSCSTLPSTQVAFNVPFETCCFIMMPNMM